MRTDNNILKKVGKQDVFNVPEGYFEKLTSEVMDKLPEKETVVPSVEEVTMWTKLKPLLYLAAMFVGAALIIRVASGDKEEQTTAEVATEISTTHEEDLYEEYIDAALDQSMMDDYALYVYLSDPETN